MIGYAFCGSFCTHARALSAMEALVKRGEEVLPIFSEAVLSTDTRFGCAEDFVKRAEEIAQRQGIKSVKDAEPLGPKSPLELLVIAPCTGNTLAKIAAGITDGTVTMAAKAHAREDRPTLIALASNDAASANLCNLAALLQKKSAYFLPMLQDDPQHKPHSLVALFERIPEALAAAREGKQIYPLFLLP